MRIIDTLKSGELVSLGFTGTDRKVHTIETVQFRGITGEGNSRLANFRSFKLTREDGSSSYDWQAYRYGGHWTYGTSAQRLRLL